MLDRKFHSRNGATYFRRESATQREMAEADEQSGYRRILAGVLLALFLVACILGTILWSTTACREDIASHTPAIQLNVSYDDTSRSLTIVNEIGDRLPENYSGSVTVQIRPTGSDTYTNRYVLASNSVGGYPIRSGDWWTFGNASVNGRPLSKGDVVRIHYTGPSELPSYCPNRSKKEATLAKYVVE